MKTTLSFFFAIFFKTKTSIPLKEVCLFFIVHRFSKFCHLNSEHPLHAIFRTIDILGNLFM